MRQQHVQSPVAGRELVHQAQDTGHGDACVKRLERWGKVQIILLSEAEEVESSHFPPYSHFHRKLRFRRVSDLSKGSIDIKQ